MGTDIEIFAEVLEDGVWVPHEEDIPELGRPYELFSVLRGETVAFGLGRKLATVPYVSKPRGFPDDLHPTHRRYLAWKEFEDGGEPGYPSWLGVHELVDFDWDGLRATEYCFVDQRYADLFDRDAGFPVAFPEDEKLYADLCGEPPAGTVRVEWSTPLREYVGCVEWFLDMLLGIGPPDEVRIIYWFF